MCLMQTRVHRCRHCTYTWTHPDHLDLCPEGEKLLLDHGHLCAIHELATKQGHRIMQRAPERSLPVERGPYSKGGLERGGQGEDQNQNQVYVNWRKREQREMEDMCEKCKGRHMKEWADEARGRVVQGQGQELEQQQAQHYHSQYQVSYQGGNGMS